MPVLLIAAALLADNDLPKEVREAFDQAAEIELYSLNPNPDREKTDFHGWQSLGKTTLKGEDLKTVRDAVEKGRKESTGDVAGCFIPRHGIRIVREKKTYDLVICYQCLSAAVYDGDKKVGSFLTTRDPVAVLNKVLSAAKVPLPKD
jgi:hypothetical protein